MVDSQQLTEQQQLFLVARDPRGFSALGSGFLEGQGVKWSTEKIQPVTTRECCFGTLMDSGRAVCRALLDDLGDSHVYQWGTGPRPGCGPGGVEPCLLLLCHYGEGAEPGLEVEKAVVSALTKVGGTLLSFALFAEPTVTVAPGDSRTQLPTQPARPPSKLLSLQLRSCSSSRT